MKQQSYLKTILTEVNNTIDKKTGEVISTEIKNHKYLANTKEEFFLIYSTLIGVFQKISAAEIRVYAFLLQHYAVSGKIVINDIIRQDIVNKTGLTAGSINNAFTDLTSTKNVSHPLLHRLGRGTYQLNPRYAFRGSSQDRNNSLKSIIELGCDRC
jgi:hypothetical protein